MVITKQQAIDILERFDFFQGQRAGRELWNDKPKDVQDKDIADFSRDVGLLKEYINTADVVPKSEVENLKLEHAGFEGATRQIIEALKEEIAKPKTDAVWEIFEEIEKRKVKMGCPVKIITFRYSSSKRGFEEYVIEGDIVAFSDIAELKKKYTEGEECL